MATQLIYGVEKNVFGSQSIRSIVRMLKELAKLEKKYRSTLYALYMVQDQNQFKGRGT
jgi:hypothetical protein